MQTTIYSAMEMLTSATSIKHILDDDAEKLSCGQVHYALEFEGRLFVVWKDMDSDSMIVSPMEYWDQGNLLDAMDDPMPLLSYSEVSTEAVRSLALNCEPGLN
ncbi:hypothetical protein RYR38_002720 [Edwardsiella piscicida]|uniref:hypothetical protein n=1 Tax=Edwardsiella piscicida TaxID=1263550 RepID=UPI00054CAC9A|nr:hypothetical protein [Edwardsiella piscicida]